MAWFQGVTLSSNQKHVFFGFLAGTSSVYHFGLQALESNQIQPGNEGLKVDAEQQSS